MTKEDFIKKFPDIKIQQFETETILSKQEIMNIVEQATQSMDMGLVYYEHCGCNITVFTSEKMKAELANCVREIYSLRQLLCEGGVPFWNRCL